MHLLFHLEAKQTCRWVQYLQVFSARKKTLSSGFDWKGEVLSPQGAQPDPTGASLKETPGQAESQTPIYFCLSESKFVTQSHRTPLCSSSSNTKNKSGHLWEILCFVVYLRLDVLDPINIWFLHCNLQAENFLLKHYPAEHSSVRNLPGFMPVSPNCFWELIQTQD